MRNPIGTNATSHWRWEPLGELCNIKYGKLLATNQLSDSGYPVFGANGVIGYHTSYLYRDEEVLISCRGAYSGKVNLSPPEAYITNNSLVLEFRKPSEICKRFYYYALQIADKSTLVTGTAQPQVTINNAINVKVPVAPLDVQRQIVAEIEKQFTRLEAGVAGLRRVQANLKRYRAAVLKAACEGKLVATEAEIARQEGRTYETGAQLLNCILTERREKWTGQRAYKEPVKPDLSRLSKLPEGWMWATVEQVNLAGRPCAYGVLQPGEDIEEGVPFVRVGDINNGRVGAEGLKRISPTIAAQYPRTRLSGGEFAITLVGAIGRTAIIPTTLAGGNVARAVGIVPLTGLLNAHWIEIWFRNPRKIAEMVSKSHEVARKTLNLEDVRAATIAIPPHAEQQRIIAEVERSLSVVEELEAVVNANLQRGTRLRQSILQQAFSGQIV